MSGIDDLDDAAIDAMFAGIVSGEEANTDAVDDETMFVMSASGDITVNIPDGHRLFLATLVSQLAEVLRGDGPEAQAADLVKRLYPSAYEDPVDEAGFAVRSHELLHEGRVTACRTFLGTVTRDTLTAEEADCWLRVLNDVRLVIARDVEDDEAMESFYERGTADAAALALCSYLLSGLVEAITG